MKESMALALQQKAVSPVLQALLPMAPELAEKLVVPICNAIKTCYCKDELAQVELQKIWASVAPQYLDQLGNFIKLMGQVVDAISEYDKLTIDQTNMVIEKICSEPNVPFAEKQEAIRKIIQNQQAHKEAQTKTYVVGGLGASAVAAGAFATKVISDNRTKRVVETAKLAKEIQKTNRLIALTPAGPIKALGDVALGILKTIKK